MQFGTADVGPLSERNRTHGPGHKRSSPSDCLSKLHLLAGHLL